RARARARGALACAALAVGAGCSLLLDQELADKPGEGGGSPSSSTGACGPLDTLESCGACGKSCAPAHADATCAAGTCGITGCQGTFADCNGVVADGCEVDTASDPGHCGGCDVACTA